MKKRLPRPPKPRIHSFSWMISIVVLLLIGDLVYLHFSLLKIQKTLFYRSGQVPKQETYSQSAEAKNDPACSPSCLTSIRQVETSLESKINSLPLSQTIVQSGGGAGSTVKEYFVAFGSGTSSSGDWQDVQGLQAYVDKGSYPSIKSAVFEASLLIPTGNQTASVRLYNVTDKHPVWKSELTIEGGTGRLLTSPPLTLDAGNKLYQVQMKTSLKYEAKLNQARLHITLK